MDIRLANVEDIDNLEELASKCFEKFKLSELGMQYDSESFKKQLFQFIDNQNDIFTCFVAIKYNKVQGATIVAKLPTQYHLGRLSLNEMYLQASPELPSVTQARVVISLIDKIESFAREESVHEIHLTTSTAFDLSENFKKSGYKLIQNTFMKGVK